MGAVARFKEYAGQRVRVMDGSIPLYVYVLRDDDLDEAGMRELLAEVHPPGTGEPLGGGWQVVAIEGEVDEGEKDAEASGLLAIHDVDDKAYICDEGRIRHLTELASELAIITEED